MEGGCGGGRGGAGAEERRESSRRNGVIRSASDIRKDSGIFAGKDKDRPMDGVRKHGSGNLASAISNLSNRCQNLGQGITKRLFEVYVSIIPGAGKNARPLRKKDARARNLRRWGGTAWQLPRSEYLQRRRLIKLQRLRQVGGGAEKGAALLIASTGGEATPQAMIRGLKYAANRAHRPKMGNLTPKGSAL